MNINQMNVEKADRKILLILQYYQNSNDHNYRVARVEMEKFRFDNR